MTARYPDVTETVIVEIGHHEYRLSRCAYTASGVRCAYQGTISHTTMNHGPRNDEAEAKFYCRYHFDCHDPAFGAKVVEGSHRPAPPKPKEPEKKNLPVRSGNLAWAQRIIDRLEAGEALPRWSVHCACVALGIEEKNR